MLKYVIVIMLVVCMVMLVSGDVQRRSPEVIDRAEYGVCFKSRGRINTGKFSSWRAAFKIRLPSRINIPKPDDFCDPEHASVKLWQGPTAGPEINNSNGSTSIPHWRYWEERARTRIHNYYYQVNQKEGSKIVGPRACYNGQLLYGNYLKLRRGLLKQITADRRTVEMLIPEEPEPW